MERAWQRAGVARLLGWPCANGEALMTTWLVYTAVVVLYPRTALLPGADDCDMRAFLERFRREASPLLWLGVVAGAVLFHVTPIFTVFVPLPAFLLRDDVADRHADRISNTPIYLVRQSIFLVKLAGGFAWGAHPDVRARFALPPLAADPGTWRVK
jgi:hypothetical protein